MEGSARPSRECGAEHCGWYLDLVLLVLWRLSHFVALVEVLKSLLQDHKDVLQDEAENVSRMFQNITEEIMGEYGYDTKDQKLAGTGNSTQEQFFAKTLMRCDCEH